MNRSDISRNRYMLEGPLAKKGYDWWWHSFTGYNKATGEAKAFFIEYFIINPARGEAEPVFGQLPKNREAGIPPSYVMIKAGCWGKNARQIHSFYPAGEFACSPDRLDLKVGNCTLTETEMAGSVQMTAADSASHPEYMSDAGKMSWNLSLRKKIAFNVGYGASAFFRKINAFEMFWHAEGMRTDYSGSVILDGIEYAVAADTSFGYADKNWGADYTSPWVWLGSCAMKSLSTGRILSDSAIDIGGGRPKVFGFPLDRKLLVGFWYEGRMYEYNFAKFWKRSSVRFEGIEEESRIVWKVTGENGDSVMELEASCPKDEMLLVNYEAPDGRKRHDRLWNGGTGTGEIKLYEKTRNGKKLVDRISLSHIGCEYGEYGPVKK